MATSGNPAVRARKAAAAKPSKPTLAKRVKVSLEGTKGTTDVTVLPYSEWGYAWRSHWKSLDFGPLVEDIVIESDWSVFETVRPSETQVAEFLMRYGDLVGVNLGESRASKAS